MNWLIRMALEKGWGKAYLTTALRHGLTSLGAVLVTLLVSHGVSPDTANADALYIAGMTPLIIATIWSVLDKKFGVAVATEALVTTPEASVANVVQITARKPLAWKAPGKI